LAKACRALEVRGHVQDEKGAAIVTSAPLDRSAWYDLAPAATLSIEHTLTTRELVFVGPGRVRPCVNGEERFFVARGTVRTSANAGARPGAEVLVATPHGLVRYGDARLEIRVEPRAIAVRADSGDAWFESRNADGSGISEEKIPAGQRLSKKSPSV